MLRKTLLTLFLILSTLSLLYAQSDDGIPGNCDNARGHHYRQNAFARYEPQNSRVVLVDWSTGADLLNLETNLVTGGFQVRGWSRDCRYLVGAIGTSEDMDTVIWDTVNGGRVGTVENAVGRPHHYTWSPDSTMLVVESRHGAALLNITTGGHYPLTTTWDSWGLRNFRAINWDYKRGWLDTSNVENTRLVYSLGDGQMVTNFREILLAESGLNVTPVTQNCSLDTSYSFTRVKVENYYIRYDRDKKQLYLQGYFGGEANVILEENLEIDYVYYDQFKFTSSCRYVVGSIRRAELVNGQEVYDTIAWDTVERRRAAVFEDARNIPHTITIAPTNDAVIIGTRDGAYWWTPSNDARILMTDGVFTRTSQWSRPSITHFYSEAWDLQRQQFLAVTVNHPNAVTAYDFNGQQVAQFYLENANRVRFIRSSDNSKMVLFTTSAKTGERPILRSAVWDRDTGNQLQLNTSVTPSSQYWGSSALLSPDNRYLMLVASRYPNDTGYVWDLQNLREDKKPNYVNMLQNFNGRATFLTPTILQSAERRWNILTGELIYIPTEYTVQPNTVQVTQTSGFTAEWSRWGYLYEYDTDCAKSELPIRQNLSIKRNQQKQWVLLDAATGETLFVFYENNPIYPESARWVGGCRYILGSSANGYTLWDSKTLQPVPLPNLNGYRFLNWSPDADRVILKQSQQNNYYSNYFIWEVATGALAPLSLPDWTTIRNMYWDYAHHQLLIADGYGYTVYAFDLSTGALLYTFVGSSAYITYQERAGGEFNIAGQWLYIRGSETLTLFNLDTLENQQVWVRDNIITPQHISISPDGRYLVIAWSGIRVWDLHNLPSSVPARISTDYPGPDANIVNFYFVDSTVIEVNTINGETSRWDVSTGSKVSP